MLIIEGREAFCRKEAKIMRRYDNDERDEEPGF